MRVIVMTPSRNKILLDGVETLRDVKRQIMTKTGIPASQQLVYFRGKLLKSLRRPLAAYHVRDDSTLYLVKRLRVCRCLACRNSRYIEREEVEEERQQLQQLLGDDPEDDDLTEVEPSSEVTDEVSNNADVTGGRDVLTTWLINRNSLDQRRFQEVENFSNEEECVVVEENSDAEGVGEERIAELEENGEEGDMDEGNEADVEAEEGEEEDVEEAEEEEEEAGVEADEGEEEGTEEIDETNQEEEGDEEEAMEGVSGETDELNEENEEADAAEEELQLSGEDADDEEENEEAAEEEDTEVPEAEDIEDEPLDDLDEDPTEEVNEEVNEEEDEDATILYSLVTGQEDNPQREELEIATDRADEEEEEQERPAQTVFARQPAFEEDGANSVGEEDPDIADLEEEEELTPTGSGRSAEDNIVPERVEDLLLAMTRPTPDPEAEEEDRLEEQYPEDDPLFDPPDEEDPLLVPREEEDAGYISGDEMENA